MREVKRLEAEKLEKADYKPSRKKKLTLLIDSPLHEELRQLGSIRIRWVARSRPPLW
jgi:hypothetical protein